MMTKVEPWKIMMAVSAFLIMIMTGLAFFTAPVIGSSYSHIVRNLGNSLPLITVDFSLPMLRTGSIGTHLQKETAAWAAAVWTVIILAPIAVMVWSMRGSAPGECIQRWVSGMSIYVPLVLIITMIVIVGLILPFTCLSADKAIPEQCVLQVVLERR